MEPVDSEERKRCDAADGVGLPTEIVKPPEEGYEGKRGGQRQPCGANEFCPELPQHHCGEQRRPKIAVEARLAYDPVEVAERRLNHSNYAELRPGDELGGRRRPAGVVQQIDRRHTERQPA